MATVYPTAAGLWSTRTWNNDATGAAYGSAPQAGDIVLLNNVTVDVDQNITVTEIATRAGTTAAAGGQLLFSSVGGSGRTVTAAISAGTTNCVLSTLTSPSTSTVIGTITAGTATNAYGARNNASGAMTITGNATGGSGSSAHGLFNSSTGSMAVTGNVTGGSGSNATGCTNSSSGTVTITGNATGGSNATGSRGFSATGTGACTLTGTAIGGTTADSPGAFGTTSGTMTISDAQFGSTGSNPFGGFVRFSNGAAATIKIRDTSNVEHTLQKATASVGFNGGFQN